MKSEEIIYLDNGIAPTDKSILAAEQRKKSFKIFKSIECDICVCGELDYEEGLLKQFDMVIVSIHQQ
jgi:histidinol phosphatase-like PHP family hydrolase